MIPLGLPRILLADGVADTTGPWIAVLAPLLNLAILVRDLPGAGGTAALKGPSGGWGQARVPSGSIRVAPRM